MSISIHCGHIPAAAQLGSVHYREHPSNHTQLCLRLPHLNPTQLHTLSQYLRNEARSALQATPVAQIVDSIDRCARAMLDATQPLRTIFEPALQQLSGFDPELLRLGINACLRTFRRPELLRLLAEDLGDSAILDEFRPRPYGGWTRAYGASLLGQIWAGNVPGIPMWGLSAALLSKSPSINKLATAEPLFATWFAQTLSEIDPVLSQSFAILWWPGGESDSENCLAEQCDVMKVYGSQHTLAAWQRRLPAETRFLAHGHKFSAAFIHRSALDTRQAQHCARLAANDIVQWDQQACYAPQSIFVERGADISPKHFATLLAGALAAKQQQYPRRPLDLDDKQHYTQWQQQLRLRALQGETLSLSHDPAHQWSVAYIDAATRPEASATHRSVSVIAVDHYQHALTLLAPLRNFLQTLAVAAEPEALFAIANHGGSVGIHRICALGASASPPSGWHHDGRFSLLDLLRFVDLEASGEALAQEFSSYRD